MNYPQPYYQPPQRIVTKTHRDTSHTFHLIMTVCTLGLWLPVWAIMAVVNAVGPRKKSVTRVSELAVASAPQTGQLPAQNREQYDERYRSWYYNEYLPWYRSQQR